MNLAGATNHHHHKHSIVQILPPEIISLILDFTIKTNSYLSYMHIRNRLPSELLPYLPNKLLCLITNGSANSPTPKGSVSAFHMNYQQKKKSLKDIVDLEAFPLSRVIAIDDLDSLENILRSGFQDNLLFLFVVLDTTQRMISWLDFDTEEEFEYALREQRKLQRDPIVLKNNFSISNTIHELQKCLSLVNQNLKSFASLKVDWILYGRVFCFYSYENVDVLTNSIVKSSKDLGLNVSIQYFMENNPLSHTVFLRRGEIVHDMWLV